MITYFERLDKHHGTAGIVLKLSHLETPPMNSYQHHLIQITCLFFPMEILDPLLDTCPAHWFELQKCPPSFLDVKSVSFPRKRLQGAWPLPI